jgi:hypothetical protein
LGKYNPNNLTNLFFIFDTNNNAMLTFNAILKELKDVPVSRLEELYQLVHSMTPKTKHTQSSRKKILSFGGAFSDMSNKDYTEYLNQTKKSRTNLFDRNVDI